MIYPIIQEIKADSSKNAKIAILTKHKDNQLLQDVIVACYSPYVQYYIRKIPAYTKATKATIKLDAALDMLSALSDRTVTGAAAKAHLVNILESLSFDDAYIVERIIKKSMDAGFSESTANKVWKGLVPTYPCLLAKGCDEKTIKKMTFPAYSQLKADGMRINVHIKDGKIHMCGRSGKTVDILGELDADMFELAKYIEEPNIMFDGELVLVEDDGSVMERKKGNGKLNKAIRGSMPADEAARVRIRVWDVISQDAFDAQKDDTPYHVRYTILKAATEAANVPKTEIIETIEVADLVAAEAHFAEMLKRGEEGTLLKSFDHAWEDKRSYGLLKMKAIKDADLEVVGWVEGTGKYEGMLGALVCQSSDGKIEVSIGSGFSDKQRKTYTEKNTVGRVVEILYNERITSRDRTETDSLFLPRFVELREDKDVANSSAEIK
jgi:ATP-dependent DNA ligase